MGSNYYALERGYGVKKNTEEYYDVERKIAQFCRDHRVEPLRRHLDIRPKLRDGLGDTVIIDWEPFDKRVGSFEFTPSTSSYEYEDMSWP